MAAPPAAGLEEVTVSCNPITASIPGQQVEPSVANAPVSSQHLSADTYQPDEAELTAAALTTADAVDATSRQPTDRHSRMCTLFESLGQKPAQARKWWRELCATFEPNFLVLICSVYFLQGLGFFPTYVQNCKCAHRLVTMCHNLSMATADHRTQTISSVTTQRRAHRACWMIHAESILPYRPVVTWAWGFSQTSSPRSRHLQPCLGITSLYME